MAGNGAILDLGWAIPDRDGINDLAPRLACRACSLAPPHDPAAAKMGHQFLLENATRLNEQAFVDRLMRHLHLLVLRVFCPQPPGYLLRRPLVRELLGDKLLDGWCAFQQARLGATAAVPRPIFSA